MTKYLTQQDYMPDSVDGRESVSAQALLDNPDVQGYIYRPNDYGLDPWTTIQGVDQLTDGSEMIVLEYSSTGDYYVSPRFLVYISEKDTPIFTNEEKADMKWESQ